MSHYRNFYSQLYLHERSKTREQATVLLQHSLATLESVFYNHAYSQCTTKKWHCPTLQSQESTFRVKQHSRVRGKV